MSRNPSRSTAAIVVPVLLLAYLLVTSVADPLPRLGVYNAKRLLQTLLLTVLPALALLSPSLRRAVSEISARVPPAVAIAVFSIALLVTWSSARVPLTAYALAENGLLALTLLAAMIVAGSRRIARARFDRIALLGLATLCGAVAVQELMGVVANWALGLEFSFGQMLMHFAHPRFYNQLQTWTLPLLAGLPLLLGDDKRGRGLTVLVLGLGWCVLLMSGGRGSMISIVTALALVGLVSPWQVSRQWAGLHAGGLVLGLALITAIGLGNGLLAPAGGEFVERSVGRPLFHSTGRTYLWGIAFSQARSRPWLGIGTGYYNCGDEPVVAAHPHSFPLQILAEWGLPATILVLVVFLWLAGRIVALLRGRDPPDCKAAVLVHLLCASLIAAAIHSAVSGVLLMPAAQMTAAIVGGWLIGTVAPPDTPSALSPGPRLFATGIMVLGLLAGASVAAFSLFEIGTLSLRTQALAETGVAHPRYWQYGQICRYSD